VGTGRAASAMIRGYDVPPPIPGCAMTPRPFLLSQQMADYVRAGSEAPDEVVTDLVAETAAMAERGEASPTLQVGVDQAALLQLLTRALGARTAVEIGTFTGLSALAIARGLPDDGRLLCLDLDADWTAVARRYWDRAGVGERVELTLGPALDSLRALPAEPTFDLAFVDADKQGYAAYVAELHPRMRPDGVVLLDNTLRGGHVLEPVTDDDRAIAELNAALAADPRWETVLLPLADGLTMLRRR
jgi:predicted O-methyltransferase YrrM